jgi:hypothetical protein
MAHTTELTVSQQAMKGALMCALGSLFLGGPLFAGNVSIGNESAQKFGVYELTFTGNGGVTDPFATAATVTFTPPSGSGKAKTVEMFWDGGNTWRARAYVSETGNWSWTSTCASDSMLDAKRGVFRADPSALRGKLRPHHTSPRALMTDDGKWFAPIGDTAYYMLGSEAYQQYVRDDWNQGINFLRCAAFGDLRSYSARFTEQRLKGIPKLSSLQSEDTKLKWMLEQYPGVYLQYILFRENAAGEWDKYSVTAKNQLLQQLVARYAAFPTITWMIMNDSEYPKDGTGNSAVVRTVSSFLVARDVYQNLRCTGARRGMGAPFANSTWTTFLHLETLDALSADEADLASNKFVWCGEDRYETYKQPKNCRYFFRRLMWSWLLSGGSACYGGDWDATIPYCSTNLVGLHSVATIRNYFEHRNIDLGLFRYKDSLAADTLATGRDRPQVCNRGTLEYIVYHPNSRGRAEEVNVNDARTASFALDLSAASGTFAVEWFRCLDGVTLAGASVNGGAVRTLTAPWAGQDVVCRLTCIQVNKGETK